MEVGAVKQAFNNEVILLKRSLNQARIQVIHKLTRKAKVLLAKKAPEKLQEKLKRKAEAAVSEVLIMKKIKPKDLAKFIVTHKEDLNKYLNKPSVDLDKACARLLLHKSLQDKYKQMRLTYFNIHIDDLFMSRLERQKIKKEKKEQMNKKNNKNDNKTNNKRAKKNSISSEGDWRVEDVLDNVNSSKITDVSANDSQMAADSDDDSVSDYDNENLDNDKFKNLDNHKLKSLDNDKLPSLDNAQDSDSEDFQEDIAENKPLSKENDEISNSSGLSIKVNQKTNKNSKTNKEICKNISIEAKPQIKQQIKEDKRTKLPKTNKNKNKKSEEGFHTKKHTKEKEEVVFESSKVVDPFFKTVTGDSYMSLVEPRAPDEVKEIHYQGNRQMRRAVQFGHAPRMKPRQNYRQEPYSSRFNQDDNSGNNYKNKNYNDNNSGNNYRNKNYDGDNSGNNKFSNNFGGGNYKDSNDRFKKPVDFSKEVAKEEKPEKLHPSWEAKKKISNILPFKGKKTTFDED